MHITYEITIGNLLAIFMSAAGAATTLVVWFWKYQKRDDELHDTVSKHTGELVKVTAMCKAVIEIVQKLMILQMHESGNIEPEALQHILKLGTEL